MMQAPGQLGQLPGQQQQQPQPGQQQLQQQQLVQQQQLQQQQLQQQQLQQHQLMQQQQMGGMASQQMRQGQPGMAGQPGSMGQQMPGAMQQMVQAGMQNMQGGQQGVVMQQAGQQGQARQPGHVQQAQGQQVASWRTWHSDADYEQRKQLITHIFRLFTGRQKTSNLRQDFKDKLPDFVKRLEEALYRTAHSKEEYIDTTTLEARLQNVARRMIRPGAGPGGQQANMANMLDMAAGPLQPQQQQMTGQQANPGVVGLQQRSSPMLQQQQQGQMGNSAMMNQQGPQQPGMAGSIMGQQSNQQQMQMQMQMQPQNMMSMHANSPALPVMQPPNGNVQINGQMQGLLRGDASRDGQGMMSMQGQNQMLQAQNRMASNGTPTMQQSIQQSPNVMQQQVVAPMMQSVAQNQMMRQQAPNMMMSPSLPSQQQQQVVGQQQMINASGMIGQQGNLVGMSPQLQQAAQQQQIHQGQNLTLQQQQQQQMLLRQQALRQQQQQQVQAAQQVGMNMAPQQQQQGQQQMVQQSSMNMVQQQQQQHMAQQVAINMAQQQQQQPGMVNQNQPGGMPGQQPGQQQQGQPQPTPHQVEALKKQQKWLLFLRHCIKCQAPLGQCQTWQQKCQHGKSLIRHIENCRNNECDVAQCTASKKLLKHHQRCQNPRCLVCGPVNNFVAQQKQQQLRQQQQLQSQINLQQQPGMQPGQQPGMQPGQQPGMGVQPGQQLTQQQQLIHQQQLQQRQQQLIQQQQLPPMRAIGPGMNQQPGINQQQMLQQQQRMQQQQHLAHNAMRSSALQSDGGRMMETPGMVSAPSGMMPTPGPNSMPTPGIVGNSAALTMPNPGMQASMQQPGMMNGPGNMGMQGQGTGIIRGQASMQMPNQGYPGQGSGQMISGTQGSMMPTPQTGGGMMPTPQANSGMMPTPGNQGSVMMPTPGNQGTGMMSSGMMPAPGTMGSAQPGDTPGGMMPAAKRTKVEGQFSGQPVPPVPPQPTPAAAAQQVKVESSKQPQAGAQQPTSLIETFTKNEISMYLAKLKTEAIADNQRAAKGKKADDKAPPPAKDESPCLACHNQRKSFFEPPVLYCYRCDKKIKENLVYYHAQLRGDGGMPSKPGMAAGIKDVYWCHSCFQDIQREKSDVVHVEGEDVAKTLIIKKKNDDIQEEGWVQCDSCDAWVHQICGLFNRLLNDDNNTHYQCPECLLKGLEKGSRKPITTRPSSMLEAKDLPQTKLSKFLEDYLAKSLGEERVERAKMNNKPIDETPAVEGLTVRVVGNLVKKCETKPNFFETFKDKNYPAEFPYRQKCILLFQKLDGVDVLLFCMYTQEYGDDTPMPNRRTSYLSYLDSVKYFRPDGVTAANRTVALRTFVYHELLIAYLDYLRQRGFYQMFIWACPPTQGDDYILYAHPKTQKNPALSKLREWYLKMLRRAHELKIVSRVSNVYDTYFEGGKDHRLDKVSAMDLPYFEGDYWPGVAETMIKQIGEEQTGKQPASTSKKATTKKGSSSRSKANSKGKVVQGGQVSTDEQLMTKLGEAISGAACNKEDLMVVHLQHVCCLCRTVISGGMRYCAEPLGTGEQRKFEGIKLDQSSASMGAFTLCESCYISECARTVAQGGTGSTRNRSLPGGISTHDLVAEKTEEVAAKVEEWDPDMENEIFNTRQQFLSLQQGNHYQFDTTRRTRHSSMMILYHLHNPTAPAFAGTCNICNAEIEPGDGYRCTTCDDFDMCRNCHTRGQFHEHPLERQTMSKAKAAAASMQDRRKAVQQQVQQTLELLKHSSTCVEACSVHKCDTMKKVILHMKTVAQYRQPHDCKHCRQMAKILKYHASLCKQSDCAVYMCRDLKDAMRRVQLRQEKQRAAAYQNMLAQQRAQQQAAALQQPQPPQ